VESDAQIPLPAGTASKLWVKLTVAPGGGDTVTVTVRRNGASTPLGCTITGSGTTCTDATDSVVFAEGDRIAVLYTESGGTNTSRVSWSLRYATP
jgi:hypothetical protein